MNYDYILGRQEEARRIEMNIIHEQAGLAREEAEAWAQYFEDEEASFLADEEEVAKPSRDIVIVGCLHERLRSMNNLSVDEETEEVLFYMARQVFEEHGYILQKEGAGYYAVPPLPELAV
jgi:hypothetical protein